MFLPKVDAPKSPASSLRTREHLLPEEVEAMRSAIKKSKGRHAHRNSYQFTKVLIQATLIFSKYFSKFFG